MKPPMSGQNEKQQLMVASLPFKNKLKK